jgi:hypothetical protein
VPQIDHHGSSEENPRKEANTDRGQIEPGGAGVIVHAGGEAVQVMGAKESP